MLAAHPAWQALTNTAIYNAPHTVLTGWRNAELTRPETGMAAPASALSLKPDDVHAHNVASSVRGEIPRTEPAPAKVADAAMLSGPDQAMPGQVASYSCMVNDACGASCS